MNEPPPRPPKRVLRVLRELARTAHERELGVALRSLQADFDAWHQGRLDSYELTDRVHRFHQGPARELHNRYSSANIELVVAHALVDGILTESEVPAEVRSCIARHVSFYRETQ